MVVDEDLDGVLMGKVCEGGLDKTLLGSLS